MDWLSASTVMPAAAERCRAAGGGVTAASGAVPAGRSCGRLVAVVGAGSCDCGTAGECTRQVAAAIGGSSCSLVGGAVAGFGAAAGASGCSLVGGAVAGPGAAASGATCLPPAPSRIGTAGGAKPAFAAAGRGSGASVVIAAVAPGRNNSRGGRSDGMSPLLATGGISWLK